MPSRRRALAPLALLASAIAFLALGSPSVARADFLSDVSTQFTDALGSGNYLLAFGLIYLVGLGTALTPCVYPMIAITVSVFGAREAKSKAEAAMLSTVFVLGIATPFVPLGIFVGLTGGVFGSWLANPIVLVAFAILFVALAASMFGAFELNLPMSLQNKLADVGGIGPKGAFALGLVSAFIAAPCTGPAIVGLLGYIGQTHDIVLGGAGMFMYALGLGTLFWIVGTFAVGLPKSGPWMEAVKSVFGIVMLVMALFYLRNLVPQLTDVLTRDWVLLGVAIALVVAAVAIGAIHLDFKEGTNVERARKGVGVLFGTAGGFLGVMWLMLPPPGARIEWREDFTEALAEARSTGTPFIVDFGASWCGACGELDRDTFSDPRVVREGERFIAVHVDLSQRTPEEDALLASYNQRGLPLVVMHGSEGGEEQRVTTFIEPDEMLSLMREVD
ncbi:MAG: thioredoxin family protein [Sandaracinaceae bacterium]|nr:thioredoxin family protein [Sandaracinaceae bacterium]